MQGKHTIKNNISRLYSKSLPKCLLSLYLNNFMAHFAQRAETSLRICDKVEVPRLTGFWFYQRINLRKIESKFPRGSIHQKLHGFVSFSCRNHAIPAGNVAGKFFMIHPGFMVRKVETIRNYVRIPVFQFLQSEASVLSGFCPIEAPSKHPLLHMVKKICSTCEVQEEKEQI